MELNNKSFSGKPKSKDSSFYLNNPRINVLLTPRKKRDLMMVAISFSLLLYYVINRFFLTSFRL